MHDPIMKREDVNSPMALRELVRQSLGCKPGSIGNFQRLGQKLCGELGIPFRPRQFTRAVAEAKKRRARPREAPDFFLWCGWAISRGLLPELKAVEEPQPIDMFEKEMSRILMVEKRPRWRNALIRACGDERKEIVSLWKQHVGEAPDA